MSYSDNLKNSKQDLMNRSDHLPIQQIWQNRQLLECNNLKRKQLKRKLELNIYSGKLSNKQKKVQKYLNQIQVSILFRLFQNVVQGQKIVNRLIDSRLRLQGSNQDKRFHKSFKKRKVIIQKMHLTQKNNFFLQSLEIQEISPRKAKKSLLLRKNVICPNHRYLICLNLIHHKNS